VRNALKNLKAIIAAASVILSLHMTAYASDLSDWAVNDYIESNSTGLISYKIASNNYNGNITREEFCELAINLYEKLTNEKLRVPDSAAFDDCENIAVSQAYYNGIVSGVTDTTFEPFRAVTRQEMAKILVNTLTAAEVDVSLSTTNHEENLKGFRDFNNVSDWALSSVSTMVSNSLLSGNSNNEIMPQNNTTREQAIACVSRCYRTFAQVSQDRYMLPIIELPAEGANHYANDTQIKWSVVDGASGYHVIIKDKKGNQVFTTNVGADALSYTIPDANLKAGNYSVTVGSVMAYGDLVFSLPVDFSKGSHIDNHKNVVYVDPALKPQNPVPVVVEPTPSAPVYTAESTSPKAKEVLDEAAKYLGIPYVYGGTTPAGFDCSGFVQYVFKNCGITLTRVSRDQYAKNGTRVEKSQLQPGDLVFFGTNGNVSHVGIYVGNGQMIHSPSTGKSIMYTSIESDYYVKRYIGAKRVI